MPLMQLENFFSRTDLLYTAFLENEQPILTDTKDTSANGMGFTHLKPDNKIDDKCNKSLLQRAKSGFENFYALFTGDFKISKFSINVTATAAAVVVVVAVVVVIVVVTVCIATI
uniref:Uncharacterized protein n=1 Tax=Glossina brevipalpis TaxID=37001 RepID=A0A1A9WFF7_9MUSC